jgi:hypothetical protein
MKKLLKTTLLLTVLSFALTTANAQTGKIVFESTTHNFGQDIPESSGSITHRFVFTNTGDAPVKIQNVQASCGCTTTGWTQDTVAPGNQGYVEATYHTIGRIGQFERSLTVFTDGETKQIALIISGAVVPNEAKKEE